MPIFRYFADYANVIWSLFGLYCKLFEIRSFWGTDFLCQLQGDKVGDLCFSTFQNVGIDVGSYAYVAMTGMFGYYFNINTAVYP